VVPEKNELNEPSLLVVNPEEPENGLESPNYFVSGTLLVEWNKLVDENGPLEENEPLEEIAPVLSKPTVLLKQLKELDNPFEAENFSVSLITFVDDGLLLAV
jgi:hypothetical protein